MAKLYIKHMNPLVEIVVQESIGAAEERLSEATLPGMGGWASFTGKDGVDFLVRAADVGVIASA